mgnify:CR=1 FL=1
MRFFTNVRIKIREFIKKHKNKVILILIAWIIILAINYLIELWSSEEGLITTYDPHNPIIDTGENVSNKNQEKIEEVIAQYIEYCNQKQYQEAYSMIKPECREFVYPTLEDFKSYVDYVFKTPKIYNIQNYSNKNGKYFYRVRILDDILATGLTDTDTVEYFEDKFVLEEENGQIVMSVKEFIDCQDLEKVYEDKYMKVVVIRKLTTFEEEIYTLEITNRTNNVLVISDDTYEPEITLSIKDGETNMTEEGDYTIILQPNVKRTYEITFTNFYDEGKEGQKINFKKVRILQEYLDENIGNEENIIESYNASINV